MARQPRGLLDPLGGERYVGMTLPAAVTIPGGLTVPDQEDAGRGHGIEAIKPAGPVASLLRNSPIVEARKPGYEGRRRASPLRALRTQLKEERAIPRKVFVGNLNFNTTQDQLSSAFSSAGQVVSVHIGTDRETGRSRGFAFVEFSSDEEAQKAIASFNEFELDGRKLRVNSAEDRPPRRSGPPGGGFGGGGQRPFSGFSEQPSEDGGFGGGFGKPFRKPKGSRRGLRARKRSLG